MLMFAIADYIILYSAMDCILLLMVQVIFQYQEQSCSGRALRIMEAVFNSLSPVSPVVDLLLMLFGPKILK